MNDNESENKIREFKNLLKENPSFLKEITYLPENVPSVPGIDQIELISFSEDPVSPEPRHQIQIRYRDLLGKKFLISLKIDQLVRVLDFLEKYIQDLKKPNP